MLPKAKRPPSACDAAPPQAREPLPRAGSTRWGVQHLNSMQVCGPLAPKRMMSGTCRMSEESEEAALARGELQLPAGRRHRQAGMRQAFHSFRRQVFIQHQAPRDRLVH